MAAAVAKPSAVMLLMHVLPLRAAPLTARFLLGRCPDTQGWTKLDQVRRTGKQNACGSASR
jgi:hypothetical protein